MEIDKRLNLAIPLPRANGQTVYIHSTPISTETFKQHFEIIGKVFAAIHSEGYGAVSGPRLAAMLMKKIAMHADVWDGPGGVASTLHAEIMRLTSVLVPGANPPQILMESAVKKGILSKTEADIVENAIVFFTVISSMLRPDTLNAWLVAMAGMWNAQITSLGSTAFSASLPTSTEIDSSGETQSTSSQESSTTP